MSKPIYLIVTSFFPSPGNWRCAFAYDYVKAIEMDGRYTPVVFKPGESFNYEGIDVHGFTSLELPSGIPFPLLTPINVHLFIKAFKSSGIRIEDVAIAEAYTNGRVPHLLALRRRNPRIQVIVHHHDPASFGVFDGRFRHFWLFKIINYFMRRIPYEKANLHVFISNVVKNSFLMFPKTDWSPYPEYAKLGRGIRFLRNVRIKDGYVLHNGVDTSIFHSERSRMVRRGNEFVIGCIGNFSDWKNQIQLLKAIKRLKGQITGLKCIFIGSGPFLAECQAYASGNKLEGTVEFLKEVKHENLVPFYQGLDLFCLPSYFEGFGCVFTEAWSCGVPFLTCEGQGMDDLILDEERDLWLCKVGDDEDLADKILHYFESRPIQHMRSSVSMSDLMPRFLDYLESKRVRHD